MSNHRTPFDVSYELFKVKQRFVIPSKNGVRGFFFKGEKAHRRVRIGSWRFKSGHKMRQRQDEKHPHETGQNSQMVLSSLLAETSDEFGGRTGLW